MRLGENDLAERNFEMVIQDCAYFVEGVGEGGMVLVELSAHAGVLGALAGKDEHRLAGLVGQMVVLGQTADAVGLCLVRAKPPADPHGDHRLAEDFGDRRPVRMLGAGGGQAVGHIGQIQLGVADQMLVQPVGLSGQGRRACAPRPATLQQRGRGRF